MTLAVINRSHNGLTGGATSELAVAEEVKYPTLRPLPREADVFKLGEASVP